MRKRSHYTGFYHENIIGNISFPLLLLTVVSFICNFLSPNTTQIHSQKYILLNRLFESSAISNTGVLSAALGITFIMLICVSILYVSNKIFLDKESSLFLPCMFAFLAFFSPFSLYFNQFHIVTLILVWALYLVISFRMDERNHMKLFFSLLLTSCASLIYLPIIWLCILIAIVNFSADINKIKYLIIIIFAMIAPYFINFALIYLVYDLPSMSAKLSNVLTYISEFYLLSFNCSLSVILYTCVIAIIVLIAIIGIIINLKRFKIMTERAYIRIISLLLALLCIAFIYGNDFPNGIEIALSLPISFLVFELFTSKIKRTTSVILFVLILAAMTIVKLEQMDILTLMLPQI